VPSHQETRVLLYSPEELFDLVADIDRYQEFLPWCIASRVHKRDGDELRADLVIGFKMLRETYTSRVILDRPHTIDVDYIKGPFRHLDNHWRFEPETLSSGVPACRVFFRVDFEFGPALLRRVMEPLFHEAVRRMVHAFETRAEELYGKRAA
jgi:coenzyme Q-binding protein COQ10